MRFLFCFLLALAGLASAQTIESTITKDDGKVVTVKLALVNPDADYKPSQCVWYSFRDGSMFFIHEGCAAFTRELSEGTRRIILVINGKSSKFTGNDQRSDVAVLTVNPRLTVEHTKFRLEDLAADEAARIRSKP